MSVKILNHVDNYNFNVYSFKYMYFSNKKHEVKRLSPVVDDTLVPLVYAITGSNKMFGEDKQLVFYKYFDDDQTYKDCIACIDYRDVKKVRKNFIHALLNNQKFMLIENITFVVEENVVGIVFPNDFLAKKEMLVDVQNNLSDIIKQSIDKNNKIGLMIVE